MKIYIFIYIEIGKKTRSRLYRSFKMNEILQKKSRPKHLKKEDCLFQKAVM